MLILPFAHFQFFSFHYYSPVMSSLLRVIWIWGFIPPCHVPSVTVVDFWVTEVTPNYTGNATSLYRWVDEVFWIVLAKDKAVCRRREDCYTKPPEIRSHSQALAGLFLPESLDCHCNIAASGELKLITNTVSWICQKTNGEGGRERTDI